MKNLVLKNLLLLALSVISGVAFAYCNNSQPYPAGSYIESCHNISYNKKQRKLVAYCSDWHGSYFRTELDGYTCEKMMGKVDNNSANLVGQGLAPHGSWTESCHGSVYQFGSVPILSASCENGVGQFIYSQIIASPNDAVSANEDGHLSK